MNLKRRLKAALTAFLNPEKLNPQNIPKLSPEPPVYITHQLLAGKNVLITGAGQNIGKSIALEMAQHGANIFFTEISPEKCATLEQDLKPYPIQVQSFISDTSEVEQNCKIIDSLEQNKTFIDILVNNVGIKSEKIGIKDLELADWQQIFNTNVFEPMSLTQKIVKKMIHRQTGGSILFISSIHQTTISRWLSYSASKAAIGMIIKELAVDLAPYQIRVNGIAPGWVMEDEQGNPLHHPYSLLYQHSINPRYIGRAAVYLSSEYCSKFTTGTILKIDAGLSLYNHRVVQSPPD